jgi:hypothetical protein
MELNYPFSHLIDIAPMQKVCPKGSKTMFAIASMILHRQRENPRRVDCPVEDGRDERGNNYEPPFILHVCARSTLVRLGMVEDRSHHRYRVDVVSLLGEMELWEFSQEHLD